MSPAVPCLSVTTEPPNGPRRLQEASRNAVVSIPVSINVPVSPSCVRFELDSLPEAMRLRTARLPFPSLRSASKAAGVPFAPAVPEALPGRSTSLVPPSIYRGLQRSTNAQLPQPFTQARLVHQPATVQPGSADHPPLSRAVDVRERLMPMASEVWDQLEADLAEARVAFEAHWAVIELLCHDHRPSTASPKARERAVARLLASYRECRRLGYEPPEPRKTADGPV